MIKLKFADRELTITELEKELDNNLLSLEDQTSALLEDSPRTIRNYVLYHQRYGRL